MGSSVVGEWEEERDSNYEAAARRSGAGFSEKFRSSHHSAISMPVANHTPSWSFMYSIISLSALVLPSGSR